MIEMEARKVQLTGGSSYVITLPKKWIQEHGIGKNDSLGVLEQSDGTLTVYPSLTGEKPQKKKTIDIESGENGRYLFRLLVGAYLTGYSIIELKSSKRIDAMVREAVTEFTQVAVGPEVVDETDKAIVIRDLLDPTEMPFENTLKRMHVLVKTMHEDAIQSIKNPKRAGDVIARDVEVDRFHWLTTHQYNILSRQANMASVMGITQEDAHFYARMTRIMERIGDHAVTIASNASAVKAGPAIMKKIIAASDFSLKLFDDSVDAWFSNDIGKANKTIESTGKLKKMCESITESAQKKKGSPATSMGYVAESIRRTGEYSADISEVVIDHLVRKI